MKKKSKTRCEIFLVRYKNTDSLAVLNRNEIFNLIQKYTNGALEEKFSKFKIYEIGNEVLDFT